MSVTKTTRECYEIRNSGEWANITIRCWQRPVTSDTYYCGEIAIHSSFGTWGQTWTACGVPFKRFLCGLNFDYAFTKFMGASLCKFDGEATLNEIKRDIIRQRRRTDLTNQEARAAWDAVMDEDERIESGPTDYGYAMMAVADSLHRGHPMHNYFADPCGWPSLTHYDAQAVAFWRDIWPEFINALNEETTETHQLTQHA